MNLYEHTIIARQDTSPSELKQLTEKYSKIVEKNDGEVVKTENWGLLNLSYLIKKNKKGSYIHFKIKGKGNVIDELEKNEGEVIKTENWGLLNLSYLIKKNKKGSYIHFKIKGNGNVIEELEKNESIDKKLLRYLTVKVKKLDLETNYFGKKEDSEKKESDKN